MYSNEEIESAVASGAISAEAANGLRKHIEEQRHCKSGGEEHFRLLTGFNDIFAAVGLVLLFLALYQLGGIVHDSFRFAAIAVAAWALSFAFIRKRRMALPAIVLLLSLCIGVFGTAIELSASVQAAKLTFSLASAACAAWLHWRVFAVPITVAVGVGSLLACLVAALLWFFPSMGGYVLHIIFICGILVIAYAMYWDNSDRKRETRRSDIAFWLHLLAAPLLVHPVFNMLGVLEGSPALSATIGACLLYIIIIIVSLLINRRALVVSSLGYMIYVLVTLFEQNSNTSFGFAMSSLLLGSLFLLLSVFWQQAREKLMTLIGRPASR